MLSEPKR